MDNVQKVIDLAAHISAKVENITFETIRSNENGAALYRVFDKSIDENRFVIEGETGELLGCWENEEEALENWNT
jgi:hypothetical protein